MFDIIVCGSNTVDVFVETDAELIRFSGIDHGKPSEQEYVAYPLGSKIPVKHLEFHTGGGGTNVLATFRAQGFSCGYIGKIGADSNGHMVYDWLKANKVEFLGQVGGQTGYSVILDSQAEDRTILSHKGANDELRFTDIPQHKLATKWFFGTSMLGESFNTLEKLFVFMRNHGAKTAFIPNSTVLAHGLSHIKTILSCTDVLILNKDEAAMITTSQHPARELMGLGPKIVVITDGPKGASIYASKAWGGKDEAWHIKPHPLRKILETTGAGDAFGSGFVSALMHGKDVRTAAHVAVLNAESVIENRGAKNHVLTKKETETALKQERHAVTKITD